MAPASCSLPSAGTSNMLGETWAMLYKDAGNNIYAEGMPYSIDARPDAVEKIMGEHRNLKYSKILELGRQLENLSSISKSFIVWR